MRQCGIDGRGVDAHAYLSGTSMRIGKLDDVQDLWPATCHHVNRFHHCFLTSSCSPGNARVAAGRWSASRKECIASVAPSFNALGAWRCATVAPTLGNGPFPPCCSAPVASPLPPPSRLAVGATP